MIDMMRTMTIVDVVAPTVAVQEGPCLSFVLFHIINALHYYKTRSCTVNSAILAHSEL